MARHLGDRIGAFRREAFVGRKIERMLFAKALEHEDGSFSVFYLHGPGGIGKSALLARLADDARAAGRSVIEVDGRLVECSPSAFGAAVGPTCEDIVLVIDTFEQVQGLETWLSRVFLPRLSAAAVVVIASRRAPDPSWWADPAWSGVLSVRRLQNLGADDSIQLMQLRGVPEHLRSRVLAFANGHPLALSLAADVAAGEAPETSVWTPTYDVVGVLLRQLVGELPSALHRLALALCAHVEFTTEDLLRAVVPPERAAELFDWLQGLPFIEAGRRGVYPHDVVRNILETSMRWRDPHGYEAMHQAIRPHLLEKVRSATTSAQSLRRVREFLFTQRHSPVISALFSWERAEEVFGDRYTAADRDDVLVLAEQAEGAELAAVVDHWLERMPNAFQLCRRISTGRVVGFSAWLRLTESDARDCRVDPVVDAAWTYAAEQAVVRPGEHLGISRFFIDPEQYEQSSPVMDLMLFRNSEAWLKGDGLAVSFCVAANPDAWQESFAQLGHHRIAASPRIGGTRFGLFARDWRRAPLEPWLDRLTAQALSGEVDEAVEDDAVHRPVFSRAEFDAEVRAALRSLHGDELATSPLAGSRLVRAAATDRADELRRVLTSAIEAMAANPRNAKAARALDMTFLRRTATQEAAAGALGLPFSTYRRHLTRGTELLADHLWRRELGG
jgi:hypothetical protein